MADHDHQDTSSDDEHVRVDVVDLRQTSAHAYNGRIWTVFIATSAVATDPSIAVATGFGYPIPNVNDIGPIAEMFILKMHLPEVLKLHKSGSRCMLIIDVTNYPNISTSVDTRDQNVVNPDDDQFSVDVRNIWNSYNLTSEIPTIIVNLGVSFVGLKRLPLAG